MNELEAPVKIFLKDYEQPSHWITHTELTFELFDDYTDVHSELKVEINLDGPGRDLRLDGQELELLSVSVDDRILDEKDYKKDSDFFDAQ